MPEELSKEIKKYFVDIDNNLQKAYNSAKNARSKGFDPEDNIESPIAKNMAERVEGIIGAKVPQIINSGLSKRIQELEKKFNINEENE